MVAKDCEIADDRCIQGEMAFNNNNTIERIFFKTFTKEYECNFYERDGARVRRNRGAASQLTAESRATMESVAKWSAFCSFSSCERTGALFF